VSAWEDEARDFLESSLPKASHKRIPEILRYFLAREPVSEVEIVGARVELDRVRAYGLDIGLDGHGNAVRVHLPYGAEVTETV
jgi:hypothetical protein